MESLMWRKKSSAGFDAYVVTVIHDEGMPAKEFREIQDQPGRKSCDKFSTTDLERSKDDQFPSEFWRTECFSEGALLAQIVQLVIVGNDSLYHVQRIWRVPISDAERQTWIDHLSSIYVCDTRSAKKKCPEGFRKGDPPHNQPMQTDEP